MKNRRWALDKSKEQRYDNKSCFHPIRAGYVTSLRQLFLFCFFSPCFMFPVVSCWPSDQWGKNKTASHSHPAGKYHRSSPRSLRNVSSVFLFHIGAVCRRHRAQRFSRSQASSPGRREERRRLGIGMEDAEGAAGPGAPVGPGLRRFGCASFNQDST